ncbi:MAG: type 4a pilus biogenesis protein PilO [Nitrospirae bacterium]|nr:type 4a pilus biogenesis protein PilO [Nitrospirota bacterium]
MDLSSLENMPRFQKILLIILLFVIIVGGFIYFIVMPKKGQIDILSNNVDDLNRQITINEVKLRRLDRLKVENQILQARLKELQAQLPAEQEVSNLLKQISDLSVESGLEVKLWKPGPRKDDASGLYVVIPVDVELSGGYHELGTFFDRVSKLPRIVNISNVSMEGVKVTAGKAAIQNKFIATTFAVVDKEKTDKGKTAVIK